MSFSIQQTVNVLSFGGQTMLKIVLYDLHESCSSTNAILIHPLLPTSLPVSTTSTIYHSGLTVCLPDSLI